MGIASRTELHGSEGKPVVLAEQSGLGDVRLCACGVVSLNLGAVSLRLEASALLQVQQLLEAALESMCEIASAQLPANRHVN